MHLSTMDSSSPWERTKNSWSDAELERLLRMCTGIDNLLISGDLRHSCMPTFFTTRMCPTHLAIVGNLFHAADVLDFGLPFFHRVSHLQLFDLDDLVTSTWPHWLALSNLPSLTHLAVFLADVVPLLLANLPKIQVLVLYSDDPDATPHDPRLVIASLDQIQEVWSSAQATNGVWARADSFMARKRRGDIEGSYH